MAKSKDMRGEYCYIKSLEPIRNERPLDIMKFMIVDVKPNYYFVISLLANSAAVWKIHKSDVVFEDRALRTVPDEFKHLIK
jgi:hypothetical protein